MQPISHRDRLHFFQLAAQNGAIPHNNILRRKDDIPAAYAAIGGCQEPKMLNKQDFFREQNGEKKEQNGEKIIRRLLYNSYIW